MAQTHLHHSAAVQLTPRATICLHEPTTEAHPKIESPPSTLLLSLKLKENHT